MFSNDNSIIGGLGRFNEYSVIIIGQQKGRNLKNKLQHNYGMTKPEGYRKAQRLMNIAEKFQLPLIKFIDTTGALTNINTEKRGQAEAIAKTIETAISLTIPSISVIIGEAMSGGAIAIGVSNYILMLENSIYSVISPESCSSILWHTINKKQYTSKIQKLTAQDLKKFNIIDSIIPEFIGGAHRNKKAVIKNVGINLHKILSQLLLLSNKELIYQRNNKFLNLGRYINLLN